MMRTIVIIWQLIWHKFTGRPHYVLLVSPSNHRLAFTTDKVSAGMAHDAMKAALEIAVNKGYMRMDFSDEERKEHDIPDDLHFMY